MITFFDYVGISDTNHTIGAKNALLVPNDAIHVEEAVTCKNNGVQRKNRMNSMETKSPRSLQLEFAKRSNHEETPKCLFLLSVYSVVERKSKPI
jgi:hypothetical protein